MRSINKLMVCLDLTEMDDLLIQYAVYLCRVLGDVEIIYFAHNIRFENAKDAEDFLSNLDKPLGELVVEVIEEKIAGFQEIWPQKVDYEIVVEEGESTPITLAEVAEEFKIQLAVIGKKISYRGTGIAVEKFLRVAPEDTAMLLVPETAYHQFNNILVPIDFSRISKAAINVATIFRDKAGSELSCQHVFTIPAFYFPSIKVKDLEPKLRQQADNRWKKYAKSIPRISEKNIDCVMTFNHDKSTAQMIYNHALQTNADLIVIGSRGKGSLAAFVIGSVALQLIHGDHHIPLLIVKKDN